MSETLALPDFESSYFDHDNGVDRMAQILTGFINNDMPGVIIRQAGLEIDEITQEAIKTIGYNVLSLRPETIINVNIWTLFKAFHFSRTSHIESSGYGHFEAKEIVVRRHDAIKLASRVSMRSARKIEVGSPSHRLDIFAKDKDKPQYTGVQHPGDRVLFTVYGGFLGDQLVLPAEHKFRLANRFEGIRTIGLRDFRIRHLVTN